MHQNQEALEPGANPFALGTQKCCGLLKTQILLDALARRRVRRGIWRGAARRRKIARQGADLFFPRCRMGSGTRRTSGRSCGTSSTRRLNKGESIRVFPLSNWTELDIWLYIHTENIPIVPLYFAKEREVVVRGGSIVLIYSTRSSCCRAKKPQASQVPHAVAGLRAVHGAIRSRGRHGAENHRRDDFVSGVRSGKTAPSTTTKKARWK